MRPELTLTRTSWCTIFVVMKNVTITMDEAVLRWAGIKAAEQDTSVSRLVGEMLRTECMNRKVDGMSSRQIADYLARP